MIKRLSMGLLIGALGLGFGCGSTASTPQAKECKPGFICPPVGSSFLPGFPFVAAAGAVSDSCNGLVAECPNPPVGTTTANLTQPKSGTVCLSGTVETGGWAGLLLPVSTVSPDGSQFLTTLDAAARGITQFNATIDSPLTGGVTVGATTVPPPPVDCPNASCFVNFNLVTAPGSGMSQTFAQPGAVVAPFGGFERSPATTFDTTSVEGVQFNPAAAGEYAFCISDLKFLDAAGNEVQP
jgi:hypothetical protein